MLTDHDKAMTDVRKGHQLDVPKLEQYMRQHVQGYELSLFPVCVSLPEVVCTVAHKRVWRGVVRVCIRVRVRVDSLDL